MIIRVGGGSNGIVEYLVDGLKSGREHKRDELDKRVTLSGNIDNLSRTLDLIPNNNQERYKHITLSFEESVVSENVMKDVVDYYEDILMSAYDKSEYTFYAEAHLPKIQTITNKNTGELIERKPHVHIVIPKTNLITGKALNPTETYMLDVKCHEGIQEKINYKWDLISPFDCPRLDPVSQADMLSRVKADIHNERASSFKKELVELIQNRRINSVSEFESKLKEFGAVKVVNKGKPTEHFAVKLFGDSKFTTLKSPLFKSEFIENGVVVRTRPTEKMTDRLIRDWRERNSLINKYIVKDSPKNRKAFYSSSKSKQAEILNERHSQFRRQYFRDRVSSRRDGGYVQTTAGQREFSRRRGQSDGVAARGDGESSARRRGTRTQSGSQIGRKDSFERYAAKFASTKISKFSEISVGLPGLSECHVVSDGSRISTRTEMLLSSDEHYHLAQSVDRECEGLRRGVDRFQQRTGVNHANALLTAENELEQFREIRLKLNPRFLLEIVKDQFEVDPASYRYFQASDDSYRINCGRVNLNVSDFLTKKMNLSFDEAKPLLLAAYAQQRQYFDDKAETHEKNQIIFESNIYERLFDSNINEDEFFYRLGLIAAAKIIREDNMSRLDGIAERLKRKGEDLTNSITHADEDTLSLKGAMLRAKAQREFDRNIDFKGLIKTPDANKKSVTYSDSNGTTAFVDAGSKIKFGRQPEPKQIELGLQLAAEKFGTVKLTGSKEFKEQVLQVAAERGMNIIFKDQKTHERFLKLKDLHQNGNQISDADTHAQQNAKDNINQSTDDNAVVDARQHKQVQSTEQHKVDFDFNDAFERAREDLAGDLLGQQSSDSNEKYLNIKFSFDEATDAYVMSINGVEPAKAISEKVVERLKSADKYLQHFNIDQIKSGILPIVESKGQHPPKELDVTLSQLKNPNFTTDKIEKAISMQNKTGHAM